MNSTDKLGKNALKQYIDFDQVMYLVASINYTTLYYSNGRKEIFAYTLKTFEQNDALNQQFKRIHKAYMVNGNFVVAWQKRQVLLLGGGKLPISRRRQESKKLNKSAFSKKNVERARKACN